MSNNDIRTVNKNELAEWKNSEKVLGLGTVDPEVRVLQLLLKAISSNFYPLKVDDIYGKITREGVYKFQQYQLISEDGLVGRITKKKIADCFESGWKPGDLFSHSSGVQVYGPRHPGIGWLPGVSLGRFEQGRISHFGGPYDSGDRIYGQAYISGANTPRELLKKHKKLVDMGILMNEEQMLKIKKCVCNICGKIKYPNRLELEKGELICRYRHTDVSISSVLESMDKWPLVTDWTGKIKRAGTSWALNVDTGYYIAMRFRRGPRKYRNHNNPRLLVWNRMTHRAVVVMRSDYGPAVWTRKWMDLSPPAENHLELKTGDVASACWAADDAPLGPVDLSD